jgi:hypothetical protein
MLKAITNQNVVILDQAARPQSGIQEKAYMILDPRPSVEDDKASIKVQYVYSNPASSLTYRKFALF